MTSQIPIHLRNIPWPAEIFDHPQFISNIAKWYRPSLFVEYGFGDGSAIFPISKYCERIVSVDIIKHPNVATIPNLEFYHMTTRDFNTEFLAKLGETKIDMAFIDADHDALVVYQDFVDLFPHMIENGIIFLHDTYPCSEFWTNKIFCADSWKVPKMIKDNYRDVCDILTIPIQPGLTMVRKLATSLSYIKDT